MSALGEYIHERRKALQEKDSSFSIRSLAARMGVHHSYLSKLERGGRAPLSEERTVAIAKELGENPELLLALGGKLSERVAQLIKKDPSRFLHCVAAMEQEQVWQEPGESCAHEANDTSRPEPRSVCPACRRLAPGKCVADVAEAGSSDGHTAVELSSRPAPHTEGIAAGANECLRDTMDNQRLQASVAERESRYKTLFAKNPTVQLIIDPDTGAIMDANEAACTFYGYSHEELTAKNIFEINTLSPEEIQREMALASEEKRQFFNFTHRLRDGSLREVESRSTPVVFGNTRYLHSIIVDVTERNEYLRRITQEHEKLELLINVSPDIICFKDGEGRWLEANSADLELFGLTGVDYKGKTDSELAGYALPIYKEAFQTCVASDEAAWKNAAPARSQESIPQPSGQERVFDIVKAPLFHKNGSRRGLVVVGRDITSIRENEKQQALFSAIIEHADNICVMKDLDLRVIAANQAFARAAGVADVTELVGKTDAEIFGLEPHVQPVKRYMDDERAVQTYPRGKVLEREEEVIHPGGEVHVVHTRKFPVFDKKGKLIATANISTDVTEMVRARKQLQEAEHRFRSLFEDAPLGVCTVSRAGRYLSVNDAHASMYGYSSPQEMIEQNPDSTAVYADPLDRERLLALLERQDVVRDFESKMLRKSGEEFWTARTVRAVRDDRGRFLRYDCFVEDIQSRKEAELASENARRQLLAILEQLEAGVYVFNREDRRIIYANAYLNKALGGELTGRRCGEALLMDPEDGCVFLDQETAILKQGEAATRELRFVNDRWYLCNAKLTPWFGGAEAVLVVAMDISAIKEAEQIKEDMERITRHDLKSPLNGIISLPDLLISNGAVDDEYVEVLAAIRDSGRKMLNLIDSSLSMYKLESGTYEIDWGEINVIKEFRHIDTETRSLVQDKQLTVSYYLNDSPLQETDQVSIVGDKTLIPFMFSNLVKNAVEASPVHGLISVSFVQGDPFCICIHNQGEVPAEIRDSFFNKYVTHGKFKGTGLGAYSARVAARAHGGDITLAVDDASNTTTITVMLPLRASVAST